MKNIEARNKEAHAFADVDAILEFINQNKKPGDVMVLMSNGHFDGLREKIETVL